MHINYSMECCQFFKKNLINQKINAQSITKSISCCIFVPCTNYGNETTTETNL